MKNVSVTELRRNLLECLAKVKRGERVRITSRGKVVAEIASPSASKKEAEAARARLRGSVLRYDRPHEPAIDPREWHVNR